MDEEEFGELYGMVRGEVERLYHFREELDEKVKGFYSENLDKNPNGIDGIDDYSGDFVSEEEMLEVLETAEETLSFSNARLGQVSNLLMMFESYTLDDFMFYVEDHSPEWARQLLEEEHQRLKDYESGVREHLRFLDDEPGIEYTFDSDMDIPDRPIDEWKWPREELFPFESE
jgi:hypothetical protein